MHRVIAKDEIMLVRNSRTEDEFSIAERFELDGAVRPFEHHQLSLPHFVRHRDGSQGDRGPEHGVIRRRLIAPTLARLQTHGEIVERRGSDDRARRAPVAPKQDTRRAVALDVLGGLIDAYGRTQFECRRQGDPELEAARPTCFVEAAAMPHPASGLHPFDTAGRQNALDVIRIDIAGRAFKEIRHRGDPGMGSEAAFEGPALMVDQVEKHERLEDVPDVRRAHQPRGGAMGPTTEAVCDRADETWQWWFRKS